MKIDRALKLTVAAFFSVYLFFAFYQPLEFEDGWWHLAAGRWMAEHRQVPLEDPFSFNDQRSPWILTQWLGSLSYYGAYASGGLQGVKLFRAFLFMAIVGIFVVYARRHLPFWAVVFLGAVLVPPLWTRCFIRPDAFNYIFIQLFLIVIFAFLRERDAKLLCWVPFLGCLWGNLHLGSFVFGSMIMAVSVLSAMAMTIRAGFQGVRELRHRQARDTGLFIAVWAVFLVSLTVSPYGARALSYAVDIFTKEATVGFYRSTRVIAEQLPPDYLWAFKGWWFWLLAGMGAFALMRMNKDRLFYSLLFAVSLGSFLQFRRAAVFFALICVYIFVECARQNQWRDKRPHLFHKPAIQRAAMLLLSGVFVVQVFFLSTNRVYANGRMTRDILLDVSARNPVEAVDFLLANGISGRVLTSDLLGGYILWKAYPKLKPFVDGRQLDQRLFSEFINLNNSISVKDWARIEKQHSIDAVLLEMSGAFHYRLASYLLAQRRWQLVFVKGNTLVFVHRWKFHLAGAIDQWERGLRAVSYGPLQEQLLRALASMPRSFLDQMPLLQRVLHRFPHWVDKLDEGVVLFMIGLKGEGFRRLIEASLIDPIKTRDAARMLINRIDFKE